LAIVIFALNRSKSPPDLSGSIQVSGGIGEIVDNDANAELITNGRNQNIAKLEKEKK
jgi:hypothetical protein